VAACNVLQVPATNQAKEIRLLTSDFYQNSILPFAAIIVKICRAYTNTEEDFEDYYQEVCLQIWRSRERFRGDSEWSTWIYRVSLNVCMTLLKKRKRHPDVFASDRPDMTAVEDSHPFADESLNALYSAIRQLSEVDRAVILLYLEEKSYAEIADIIGTNANNIGVRITRIKARLRRLLNEEDN
jgi:RNA polymerase sigma-70 factor (ECF subfamily)